MDIEDIWTSYRGRIRAFLRSKVANPADVDDLLQDISIKVFTGLSSIDDHQKIQPWLFQTARRTIIDFYRKSAKTKNIDPDDLWYQADDPDVLIELERCVEPFVNALAPDTAELLKSVDIEGVSQKDYARAKGLAYSTLKSRLQSARKELRRLFDNCCQMSLGAQGNIIDYRSISDDCKNC